MRSGVVLLLFATAASAQMPEGEFFQDFRGKSTHLALQLIGPDVAQVVRSEPGGLRITLPAKRENTGAVGVSPAFALSGDFEITAAYEILSAEKPRRGVGTGVNLRLIVGAPMREAASLGRYLRVNGAEVYSMNRITAVAGEKPKREVQHFPTKTRFGKLRLKRTGATLQYLVAEGASNEFRELCQGDFVTDNCKLRFVGYTGESPTGLDVRLLELRIGATKLPTRTARVEPPDGETSWVLLGGLGIAALALGFVGWWHWRRRREQV